MNVQETRARERALAALADFVPRAGRAYAAERNFDRGPGDRQNVSMLSPFVRHRIVSEREVLEAVLARHSPSAAFKFVQEVMWRTYWKGWLEAHPSVWATYVTTVSQLHERMRDDAPLRADYERAIAGETGSPAFDAWARELVEHGYLHNHARMWFASIWIFTLGLPWELGADFFLRHLLDGDPASNTLSWRWVAGRQTIGKTYLATRRNVLHYTDGRLDPGPDLARSARYETGATRAPAEPLHLPAAFARASRALLVLHDDDFGSATLPIERTSIGAVIGVSLAALRSPVAISPHLAAFVRDIAVEAVDDMTASCEASNAGVVEVSRIDDAVREIGDLAASRGFERIVVPYGTVGPGREFVAALERACDERGLSCGVLVRAYDSLTWPRAGSGFFGFAKHIPAMLAALFAD